MFRTQKQLDGTGKDIEILKQYGVPYELLDRAGYLAVEPALALTQEKFVGALRLPGDETGDCFKFTQNLAQLSEGLGVNFRYGVSIQRILSDSARITGVATAAGVLTADAYLVALGSYSPLLQKPVGIRIRSTRSRVIRSPYRSKTPAARPNPPSWTKATRSRSRDSATASGSAAPPNWPVTAWHCAKAAARH